MKDDKLSAVERALKEEKSKLKAQLQEIHEQANAARRELEAASLRTAQELISTMGFPKNEGMKLFRMVFGLGLSNVFRMLVILNSAMYPRNAVEAGRFIGADELKENEKWVLGIAVNAYQSTKADPEMLPAPGVEPEKPAKPSKRNK